MQVQDSKSCGKELLSVGAAQLNERLPTSVRMSGTGMIAKFTQQIVQLSNQKLNELKLIVILRAWR